MAEADIPACLERSREAGWNQSGEDWRLVLALGEAVGLFRDGSLIATATTVPHSAGVGWICMVLTAKSARREGHATRLMAWAIDSLRDAGLTPGLDATPQGSQVYARLGFERTASLTRMATDRVDLPPPPTHHSAIVPLTAALLPGVLGYDAARFGGDRRRLISNLFARWPVARVALAAGTVRGFAVARKGERAEHIGPVVADDPAVAIALILAVARARAGPLIVDVMDAQTAVRAFLAECGFAPQRGFIRMFLGAAPVSGRPHQVIAATGPEFG